jgi:hypothetical protein
MVDGKVYRAWTIPLDDSLGLFKRLADRMFSKVVSCGLNGGKGISIQGVAYGRMAKPCGSLPDQGRIGMAFEFDTSDAQGARSSADYVWDGWYVLNYSRVALQTSGILTRQALSDDADLRDIMDRYLIGTRDLLFKITPGLGGGYRNYQKGAPAGVTVREPRWGRPIGADSQLDLFDLLQRDLGLPALQQD